ncbi:Endoglucanase EG-1 [Asimina triloba]
MALRDPFSNTTISNKFPLPNKAALPITRQSGIKMPFVTAPNLKPLSTAKNRFGSYALALRPSAEARRHRPKASPALAQSWREIQGSNDWEGLLHPLHPLLRHEIIRYGELVAACYKVFDLDPTSKYYLNCKYGKKSMLREVGMEGSGYTITKYIYAIPDISSIPTPNASSSSTRWIGYVAVATDEQVIRKLGRRDILITFRGTITSTEWVANFMSSLTAARLDPQNPRPDVKVESGFLNMYTSSDSTMRKFGHGSCREQLLSEVSRLVNEYKDEEVSITVAGHSMGSALALLLAYDLAELGLNKSRSGNKMLTTVYSFGGPRVGNSSFKERCTEVGVKVLRIANVNDPITKLPGVFLNEGFGVLGGRSYEHPWRSSCYAHVGVELALDFFNVRNPSFVHDIDAYIGSLLRCPEKREPAQADNILVKAREFLGAQKLEWPWN